VGQGTDFFGQPATAQPAPRRRHPLAKAYKKAGIERITEAHPDWFDGSLKPCLPMLKLGGVYTAGRQRASS
jgi:hypothetical protein